MKRTAQLILVLLVAALLTGCTSTYWADRGRDAADIFTVTGGLGLGAKARVGPVATGLSLIADGIGVRGGVGCGERDTFWPDIMLVCNGVESLAILEDMDCRRGKSFFARTKWFWGFLHKGFREEGCSFGAPPVGFYYDTKWPYYTQIEAVVALGPSVRLGFNPGELLDFILGFTTLDIAGDDKAAQERAKACCARPTEKMRNLPLLSWPPKTPNDPRLTTLAMPEPRPTTNARCEVIPLIPLATPTSPRSDAAKHASSMPALNLRETSTPDEEMERLDDRLKWQHPDWIIPLPAGAAEPNGKRND